MADLNSVPAIHRDDIALWRYLARSGTPVRALGSADVPRWLRALPNFAGTLGLDEAHSIPGALGGALVVLDPNDSVTSELAARVRDDGGELVLRCGHGGWRRVGATVMVRGSRVVETLSRWLPLLTGPLGIVRLTPRLAMRHDGGHCWRAPIVGLRAPSRACRIVLFENGVPLPLPDKQHEEIRRRGAGRYSISKSKVFFSASDSSNPRTNGRDYEVRVVCPGSFGMLFAASCTEEDFAERFMAAASTRNPQAPTGRRVMVMTYALSPGGTQRQVSNLAKGLAERGFEVSIASLGGFDGMAGHFVPMLKDTGVRLIDLRRPSERFDPASLSGRAPAALDLLEALPDLFGDDVWRVATHLAVERPDVLHCALDEPNLLGAIAGVAADVPRIVLSLRSVNPTHFPYIVQPWFQRWYERALRVPNVVVSANSRAGAADYAAWLGQEESRIRVVRNGLDPDSMRVADAGAAVELRRSLGIDPSAPVLAGIFRLSSEKRPQLWLETVAELRKRIPELVALHLGDGVLGVEAREQARRLGIDGAVRWLGELVDPATVLAASDLLLLVSTLEGLPNVILEAQWLGRPVVCTAAGGAGDALRDGETGYVVAEARSEALAEACSRILEDRARRDEMGRRGAAFVRSEFSLERMIEESIALYR